MDIKLKNIGATAAIYAALQKMKEYDVEIPAEMLQETQELFNLEAKKDCPFRVNGVCTWDLVTSACDVATCPLAEDGRDLALALTKGE